MKVALVHDWLIHMRGGEKVMQALAEMYPDATIYTLFCRREKLSPSLRNMEIKTSVLQYFPGIHFYYRWLLPLLPWVISTLKIDSGTDLIISSSHCVAKGIENKKGIPHLCYCHTPMRYIWGFEHIYFRKLKYFMKPILAFIIRHLRKWDVKSNQGVTQFVANSKNVKDRIKKYYERDAVVIYPPLELNLYQPGKEVGDYYLVVSAFVPYKRIDLVIQAFNHFDRKLLVVGSGPLDQHYQRLRKTSNISFLGAVSNAQLQRLYSGAMALIFPTEEDFGIVPLEAQACATPVIAYGKGGALESVKTDTFFQEQTAESLQAAILKFEGQSIDRRELPEKVKPFGTDRFKENMEQAAEELLKSDALNADLGS